MTNHGEIDFDKRMAGQFLMNILNDTQIDKAEKLNQMNQTKYSYDTFMKLLNGDDIDSVIKSETQEYDILFPIGRKFSTSRDYLFSVNPFFVLPGPDVIYEPSPANKLITFDNHLLLNYGDIINNTIYVCFANDVLTYAAANSISEEYIMELYYPLLKEKEILSKQDLLESSELLISQTQQIMKDKTMKIYDIVDVYYNISYSKTSEIPYLERGVKSFHFILHPEFSTVLPLDVIFKLIHATEKNPLIKYNPALRQENLYRLYTDQISTEGQKLPFLNLSYLPDFMS
jgi:hypothetical protein